MAKAQDLTDQRFGRLKVLEFAGHRKKCRLWKCLCDCGAEYTTTARLLKSGQTQSCGCYQKDRVKEIRSQNLIGRQFGRLTVTKKLGKLQEKNNPNIYWECSCSCGNKTVVSTGGLNFGHSQSCGCATRDAAKQMCGPKHPNWNPLISNEEREYNKKYRRSNQYEFQVWSKAIKERDNYTCQICNIRGGKLASHHLKSWIQYPELRYDLENGICLCVHCHTLFHKKYKYKNNTAEQIKELRFDQKKSNNVRHGKFGIGL